jgi:hypothetical protein
MDYVPPVADEGDAEAEALLRAAKAAREREEKRAAAQSRPAAPEPPPRTPPDDERFAAWLATRFYWLDPTFGVFAVLAAAAICAIVAFGNDEVPPIVRLGLAVATPIVAIVPFAAVALSFARFRRWRARLGFPLAGWEALVDDPELDRTKWRPCRITVVLRGDGDAELARAALTVFAERANRCFYFSDGEDGPGGQTRRTRWSVEGLEAAGSANCVVVWKVHELCTRELSVVARRGSIDRVVLAVEGDSFYVSTGGSATD